MGQQDAYLAQVVALAEGSSSCPSSSLSSRSPFSSTLRPNHSRAVCVRGKDLMGWHKGTCMRAGVWG